MLKQGEVGLFFVVRFSLFVIRYSFFTVVFPFRFSFFAFDIQNRAEYRILTFKILFPIKCQDKILNVKIRYSAPF